MMDWMVDLATFRSPASPMICRGYRRGILEAEGLRRLKRAFLYQCGD